MELHTIEAGGREIHYRRAGSGEPLLYLHHLLGLAGREPALEKLAESFDVIAPFAPGWGPAKDQLTDVDEGPLELTLHHCDFMAALGIDTAHVVGTSIGAWMAAELAAIFPTRVKRLVLSNPLGLWADEIGGEDPFAQHPGFPSKILFADRDGRQTHYFANVDKLDAHVRELLDLRAAAKFLWPIPETGVRKRLHRIKAATLIMTGDEDVIVPSAYGALWQSMIPGARASTLAAAGHLAALDQPQAFADAVAGFLLARNEEAAA